MTIKTIITTIIIIEIVIMILATITTSNNGREVLLKLKSRRIWKQMIHFKSI